MKKIEYEKDGLYLVVDKLSPQEKVVLYNLATGNKILPFNKKTVNSYFGSVFDFLNKIEDISELNPDEHKWFMVKDDSDLEGFKDSDLIYVFDDEVEDGGDVYEWIEDNKDKIKEELGLDFQNITKIEIPYKLVEQLINSLDDKDLVGELQHFLKESK